MYEHRRGPFPHDVRTRSLAGEIRLNLTPATLRIVLSDVPLWGNDLAGLTRLQKSGKGLVIFIRPNEDSSLLNLTLAHELCHALEYAAGRIIDPTGDDRIPFRKNEFASLREHIRVHHRLLSLGYDVYGECQQRFSSTVDYFENTVRMTDLRDNFGDKMRKAWENIAGVLGSLMTVLVDEQVFEGIRLLAEGLTAYGFGVDHQALIDAARLYDDRIVEPALLIRDAVNDPALSDADVYEKIVSILGPLKTAAS